MRALGLSAAIVPPHLSKDPYYGLYFRVNQACALVLLAIGAILLMRHLPMTTVWVSAVLGAALLLTQLDSPAGILLFVFFGVFPVIGFIGLVGILPVAWIPVVALVLAFLAPQVAMYRCIRDRASLSLMILVLLPTSSLAAATAIAELGGAWFLLEGIHIFSDALLVALAAGAVATPVAVYAVLDRTRGFHLGEGHYVPLRVWSAVAAPTLGSVAAIRRGLMYFSRRRKIAFVRAALIDGAAPSFVRSLRADGLEAVHRSRGVEIIAVRSSGQLAVLMTLGDFDTAFNSTSIEGAPTVVDDIMSTLEGPAGLHFLQCYTSQGRHAERVLYWVSAELTRALTPARSESLLVYARAAVHDTDFPRPDERLLERKLAHVERSAGDRPLGAEPPRPPAPSYATPLDPSVRRVDEPITA